jgi:hypothetical protein
MSSGIQIVRVDGGVLMDMGATSTDVGARDSNELHDERDEISHGITGSLREVIRLLRNFMELCDFYGIAYFR